MAFKGDPSVLGAHVMAFINDFILLMLRPEHARDMSGGIERVTTWMQHQLEPYGITLSRIKVYSAPLGTRIPRDTQPDGVQYHPQRHGDAGGLSRPAFLPRRLCPGVCQGTPKVSPPLTITNGIHTRELPDSLDLPAHEVTLSPSHPPNTVLSSLRARNSTRSWSRQCATLESHTPLTEVLSICCSGRLQVPCSFHGRCPLPGTHADQGGGRLSRQRRRR